MTRLTAFDLETDGFLSIVTKIHCLSMKNLKTGKLKRFTAANMEEGVRLLQQCADEGKLIGHNIIPFDIPVIQKFFPWFKVPLKHIVDTLVLSRLLYSDSYQSDGGHIKAGRLPSSLVGSHKLEAWGYRLGLQKGEYSTDFKNRWITCNVDQPLLEHTESLKGAALRKWNEDPSLREKWVTAWAKEAYPTGLEWAEYCEDMGAYCDLDVEVTEALYNHFMSYGYSELAIEIETDVRHYCSMMERSGFPFNTADAAVLYSKLAAERADILAKMQATFPPLVIERVSEKTGKPLKPKIIEFNPGSRDQIAMRLKLKYGWEPKEFTEKGKAQIDETILGKLPYDEAKILAQYFLLDKRIGQIAEGDNAWLKLEREGHIHGSINTNGAVTGRCTHSSPNVAQVPTVASLHGPECRALFGVRKGFRQLGADLSGIELRCLAHFMARWDGGAYADVILNGDIHTVNQEAAGLPTRDNAKTFIYGWLYGAGDEKIGSIVGKGRAVGKKLKESFLKKLPALGKLKEAVVNAAKRKYLLGLDGRKVSVRSEHSALNTLLQGAGALVAKRWLIEVFEEAERRGYRYGWDADFTLMAWIHDEFQFAVREGLEEEFGKMVTGCARKAGDFFKFRCPVDAEFKVGSNWKDCH